MPKKKNYFVTFEGIEGSGKSYQSRKLFNKVKKKKIPIIFTREPGGSKSAEIIRRIILTGSKNKFNEMTDMLLYMASRNEHVEKTLLPALNKKKNIICDRFIDSTLAYQVYGKGVNKSLVSLIHKNILVNLKPDLTIILKVNMKKAFQRIKKRKIINRYDKFPKSFYKKVQKAFLLLAKKNKKRYFVIDNSKDTKETENIIFKKYMKLLKNE